MGTNDFAEKEGTSNSRAPPYGLPNLKAWQDGYLAVVQQVGEWEREAGSGGAGERERLGSREVTVQAVHVMG